MGLSADSHFHTTRRFLTLALVICASGEYLVPPRSPPYSRHSPLLPAPRCALALAANRYATPIAAVSTRARTITIGDGCLRGTLFSRRKPRRPSGHSCSFEQEPRDFFSAQEGRLL